MNDSLKHFGIPGQKWGTRRWQNPDGTFNAAGKLRYFGTKEDFIKKRMKYDGSLDSYNLYKKGKLKGDNHRLDGYKMTTRHVNKAMEKSIKRASDDYDRMINLFLKDPKLKSFMTDGEKLAKKYYDMALRY